MAFDQTTGAFRQRATYGLAASNQASTNLLLDPPYTPSFEGRTAPFEFSDFAYDSRTELRRHHASYQVDGTVTTARAGTHVETALVEWDGERAHLRDALAGTDRSGVARQRRRHAPASGPVVARVRDRRACGSSTTTASATRLCRASRPRGTRARVAGASVRRALSASFGRGIKEPTVIQSFSPNPFFLGNPDLLPEQRPRLRDGPGTAPGGRPTAPRPGVVRQSLPRHHLDAHDQLQSVHLAVLQHRLDNGSRRGAHGGCRAGLRFPRQGRLHLHGLRNCREHVHERRVPDRQLGVPPSAALGLRQPRVERLRARRSISPARWSAAAWTATSRHSMPAMVENSRYSNWDLRGSVLLTRALSGTVAIDNLTDSDHMEPLGISRPRPGDPLRRSSEVLRLPCPAGARSSAEGSEDADTVSDVSLCVLWTRLISVC